MVNYDIKAVIKAEDKASNTFKKVGKSSGALGGAFKKLGGAGNVMAGNLAAGLATSGAQAVTSFVSSSVDSFGNFEASLANVQTLLSDGQDVNTLFSEQLKAMAEEIPVEGVTSLAEGLYQVLSAGVPASEALAFLEVAAKGAKGGVTDTFTAVDGLTTVLNAYALPASEANRISDIFFATVVAGKTTFGELSSAMSTVIPTASAMNVNFEEVAAAMATLTTGGLSTAESGTALNSVMVAMLKPSGEMEAAFEKLGFETGEAMLESEGLAGSMALLAGVIESGDASATDLFPRVEALKAVFPLTGAQAETFAKNLDNMANSSGAAGDAFGVASDTHQSKMQLMSNSMENLKMILGGALAPALQEIAAILSENSAEIGLLFSALGTLITGGIWVAIATFKGLYIIGESLINLFAWMGEKIVDMIDLAFLPLQLIFHALSGDWDAFGNTFKRVYENTIEPIIDAFTGSMDAIGGVVESLANFLVGNSVWTDMLDEMGKQSEKKLPEIEQNFKGLSNDIGGGIRQINPAIAMSEGSNMGINRVISINAPLVNIEGSANEEIIDAAVDRIERSLESVIIEDTSPNAPTDRIRRR